MSNYLHKKVIRLPLTPKIIQDLGFLDEEDCLYNFEKYVKHTYPKMSKWYYEDGKWYYNSDKIPYFEITYTDNKNYLDLVLFYDYGTETGEWGNVSYLSEKEKVIFAYYFKKLAIEVNPDDLRKVDFCWYNCSDPPDYYEVENSDWTIFLKE